MMKVTGIFLMTLANIILLAHVIVPHSHCDDHIGHSHDHAHVNHHHHSHDDDHDSEDYSDLSHFFCSISHVEENFTTRQHADLRSILSLSQTVIVYTLLRQFESHESEKEVHYFGVEKTTIFHSPHLIRSGEKAPPIA